MGRGHFCDAGESESPRSARLTLNGQRSVPGVSNTDSKSKERSQIITVNKRASRALFCLETNGCNRPRGSVEIIPLVQTDTGQPNGIRFFVAAQVEIFKFHKGYSDLTTRLVVLICKREKLRHRSKAIESKSTVSLTLTSSSTLVPLMPRREGMVMVFKWRYDRASRF